VGHFYSATTKNISTAHWYIIAPPFSGHVIPQKGDSILTGNALSGNKQLLYNATAFKSKGFPQYKTPLLI